MSMETFQDPGWVPIKLSQRKSLDKGKHTAEDCYRRESPFLTKSEDLIMAATPT
jgi:hypothetical protein